MNQDLKQFLTQASEAYYAGDPIISDAEFDRLEKVLGETLIVGEKGIYQPHAFRMYSLQKHYPEIDGTSDLEKSYSTVVTPKLDGLAASLLYNEDQLLTALTRGDGVVGKPITDKVRHVVGATTGWLLKTSAVGRGLMQITGELVAGIDVPNSRNAAGGSLGLLEGFEERAKEIGLTFVAYDVVGDSIDFEKYEDKLKFLEQLGFTTVMSVDESLYPTDGTVARVSSEKLFKELGYTDKFPRGAVALKRSEEVKQTTLLDVVWQTGGSGRITPVAILHPVELGGANVSRATLNNIAYIRLLDLEIGDTVEVVRAGEIIPKIVGKVPA
jgi:DNA ligase (NAD+)